MLIILPFLTGLLVFLDLLGLQKEGVGKLTGTRVALLQAALVGGAFIAIQSEILSAFSLLSRPYVAGWWCTALLVSVWVGIRRGAFRSGCNKLASSVKSIGRFSGVILAAFSVVSLLLLVVALISPANNMDSLLYHMSRVIHWAQDQSLAHYPVAFEVQLTHPILAELSILQLRLLWGSDQLASLPQWLSLILCAVTVSVGARLMGAGRKGQLAAAAFGLSLPIGLMEATSTQNDYVAAIWLVMLAVFVLHACKDEAGWVEVVCIATALGLGLLTKGTFYPYAVAWGIWLIAHWLRQKKPLLYVKRSLAIVVVVVVLNSGYWVRNLVTYGGPLGPSSWVSDMSSARSGIGSVGSNLVKYTLLNLATPNPGVNQRLIDFVKSTFQASDPEAGNFQLVWRWNNEDAAGNPLHLALILLVLAGLMVLFVTGRVKAKYLLWYSLCAIFSFIIFVASAHYDDYGVRFLLPLFLVWAPVFGTMLSRWGGKWLAPAVIIMLCVYSLPYVFFNTTRPIIAMKNTPEPYAIHPLPAMGETKSSSVFYADQRSLLFINAPDYETPYMQAANDIRNSGCASAGLRIDSHDVEYPIWWLLQAPQSGVHIETLYYSEKLSRYADANFKPCAILCTICSGQSQLHGLNLFGTYEGWVSLYMGGSYDPAGEK
jgi:hypothetical protein